MYELRRRTEEKLTRLPLRTSTVNRVARFLSRVINDIDNIDTALREGLSQLPTWCSRSRGPGHHVLDLATAGHLLRRDDPVVMA